MTNFIKKYSLTDFYYCLCIAAKVTLLERIMESIS